MGGWRLRRHPGSHYYMFGPPGRNVGLPLGLTLGGAGFAPFTPFGAAAASPVDPRKPKPPPLSSTLAVPRASALGCLTAFTSPSFSTIFPQFRRSGRLTALAPISSSPLS